MKTAEEFLKNALEIVQRYEPQSVANVKKVPAAAAAFNFLSDSRMNVSDAYLFQACMDIFKASHGTPKEEDLVAILVYMARWAEAKQALTLV